jgi:hypothetical protein
MAIVPAGRRAAIGGKADIAMERLALRDVNSLADSIALKKNLMVMVRLSLI